MKVAICFTCVFAMAYAESWMAAPYTLVKRAAQPEPQNTRFNFGSRPSSSSSSNNANTRFFTGNQALDAGLAGAAAGFAGQYIANQVKLKLFLQRFLPLIKQTDDFSGTVYACRLWQSTSGIMYIIN